MVVFRRHTLLPQDDCLYALQPSIPHLTRSELHRCLQRRGISWLPDVQGAKPKRQCEVVSASWSLLAICQNVVFCDRRPSDLCPWRALHTRKAHAASDSHRGWVPADPLPR